MKSNPMERAEDTEGTPPVEKLRHAFAVGCAVVIHSFLFLIFSHAPEKPLALPETPISVKLVVEGPPSLAKPETPDVQLPPLEEGPRLKPHNVPIPEKSAPEPPPRKSEPKLIQTERVAEPLSPAPSTTEPLSILSTDDSQTGEPIPDRWRLPLGARIPLEKTQQPENPDFEALTQSLDCFGFEADCAVQRKVVFAEDQLSETDLVWMRSYAHSGLSNADFYGMSEAQIRERLGIPTAGQNGLMLLPGVTIDGPWWDALHGVNKSCNYGIGLNDLGQKQLMKSCAPLKPSSKDKIGFIPKPDD